MFDSKLNNHIVLETMTKNHRAESMKEAQQAQMLSEARLQRLTLLDRFLILIGGILIAIGKRLQERCALVMPQGTKPFPSKY
jgi:hypothetical protein